MNAPSNQSIPGPFPRIPDPTFAWIARIAALFCIFVALAMLFSHLRVARHDPLTSRTLAEKKAQLQLNPADETLKEEIRRLDLAIRQRYFRHVTFNQMGAWMLAGGLLVFLIAAGSLATRHRPLPLPQPRPAESDAKAQARVGRWSVASVGALTALLLLGLAGSVRTLVPATPEELARLLAGDDQPVIDLDAALEEWKTQWPRFRGPSGDGVAIGPGLPVGWDGATGEGVAWKSEVPLPGFNSPVIWGDRLFLSGGTEATRAVWCYDIRDGRILWQTTVPPMTAPPGARLDVLDYTGYAASTVATDGQLVFAIFVTGELVALDFHGQVVWTKHLGVPENMYGYASSLHAEPGWLVVQYDQGEPDDNKSRLYAFDPATGALRWEQRRLVPATWTSPMVIEHGGQRQLITLADPWAIAYDLAGGQELWRVECVGGDLAPSPIYAGGLLYVVYPHQSVLAIRPDGEGDVTETHVVWQYEEGAPDITSPVSNGVHLFHVSTFGTLVCLDAQTGEGLAERQLDLEFNASPLLVDNRVLLIATSGRTLVLSADPALEEIARMELGDKVHASPAMLHGRLYVRGEEHLYAIGSVDFHDPGSLLTHSHGN
jgi:outer membrane protein assembly factor BamB